MPNSSLQFYYLWSLYIWMNEWMNLAKKKKKKEKTRSRNNCIKGNRPEIIVFSYSLVMQQKHHEKSQYEPAVVHECAVWNSPKGQRENVDKSQNKLNYKLRFIQWFIRTLIHTLPHSHSCVYCMCVCCNSPWQCVYNSLWLCVSVCGSLTCLGVLCVCWS